ncbi:MAG: DUF421 domain-containing protein [Ruminococcaceae bacterium]|nr:DUF421 domain-containing protein [Oscillospiraceae bacterium]
MITLLFRTIIIYIALIIAMRLMGKRQIGELEISDLVTTLLISEIASLPITDGNIPISHAIVPIVTLLTFEVVSSALLAYFPRLKNIMTARPTTLIRDGKLCGKAMRQTRLSADELISELRQKDITDPSEVRYAILEQNGKITVIPKAKYRPPNAEQLKIEVRDAGLYHIIIDKGVINQHSLSEVNITKEELNARLKEQGLAAKDIYLMLMNDEGDSEVIRKDEV